MYDNGKKLFKTAFPTHKIIDFQKIFCNLITTDYDKKIEDMTEKYKNSSSNLLLFCYHRIKLKKYFQNVVNNISLTILKNNKGEIGSKWYVRKNLLFILNVCKRAYDQQDLNTVWILYCVIINITTSNKFKLREKHINLIQQIKTEFGKPENCFENHIQKILQNYECLPSLMIIEMYRNRLEIQNTKQTLKKFNKINNELIYYKKNYGSPLGIQKIYLLNLENDPILENVNGKNIQQKIINLIYSLK